MTTKNLKQADAVIIVAKIDFHLPNAPFDDFANFTFSEKRHLAKIKHPQRRRRFIIGHHIVRKALRLVAKDSDMLFDIECSPDQAPFLSGDNSKQYSFNISHSGDYCVCVAANNQQVAIDIERHKRRPNRLSIAEQYFSYKDYRFLKCLPVEQQQLGFYSLWCIKESTVKFHREGLFSGSLAFDAFNNRGVNYHMIELSGYTLCVASELENPIQLYSWDNVDASLEELVLPQARVGSFAQLRNIIEGVSSVIP